MNEYIQEKIKNFLEMSSLEKYIKVAMLFHETEIYESWSIKYTEDMEDNTTETADSLNCNPNLNGQTLKLTITPIFSKADSINNQKP